jgi:hypothetical protein
MARSHFSKFVSIDMSMSTLFHCAKLITLWWRDFRLIVEQLIELPSEQSAKEFREKLPYIDCLLLQTPFVLVPYILSPTILQIIIGPYQMLVL